MTLPLSQRTMDAICLEHVLPTAGGNYVFNAPTSSLGRDRLLRATKNQPTVKGYSTVSFGLNIGDALRNTSPATEIAEDGVPRPSGKVTAEETRARNLAGQYFRGLPPEVMDLMVLRIPLDAEDPARFSVDMLGARADMTGVREDMLVERLTDAPITINPNRVVYVDETGNPVDRASALVAWVAAEDPWHSEPYATADPDVLAEALKSGYPSAARIVFDPDGRVQLGMPEALTRYVHRTAPGAGAFSGPASFGNYGDLLAHLARHEQQARIEVRALGADTVEVFRAAHDEFGTRFTDWHTGDFARFPAWTDSIQITEVPAEMSPAEAQAGPATSHAEAGAEPMPITRPPGVATYRSFGPGGRLSVDVVGSSQTLPDGLLDHVAALAEDHGTSVVVIGKPAGKVEGGRHRAGVEFLLFQHAQHALRGQEPGPMPVVVDFGSGSADLGASAARLGAPVLRWAPGAGLDFGFSWRTVGSDGASVGQPQKTITQAAFTGAGELSRAKPEAQVDATLAAYLSTGLEDVSALTTMLETNGSALKTLRPVIDALPVSSGLFAAHAKLLDLFGRPDEDPLPGLPAGVDATRYRQVVFDTAVDYLNRVKGGAVEAVPDVMRLVALGPVAAPAAVADLSDITLGTMDDGASRSILDAVIKGLQGGENWDARMKKEIFDHKDYLPERGGRVNYVRQLTQWAAQLEQRADNDHFQAVLNAAALYVTTC